MDKSENNMNNLPEESIEETTQKVVDETDSKVGKAKKKSKKEEYCPSIFDKPDYSYEKPKKERKLSKQTIAAIVSLVVCIALGFGAWGIVKLFSNNGGVTPTDVEESSEEADPMKYVYDYSDYDEKLDSESSGTGDNQQSLSLGGISRIDIRNSKDNFVLVPDYYTRMEMNTQTMLEEEVTTLEWYVDSAEGEDISGVTFDTDYTRFVVGDLLRLSYKSVYVENKNGQLPDGSMTYFEECGLDKPIASSSVTFKDGSKITVLVGSETPVKDEYYMTVVAEGSGKGLPDEPVKDEKIYIAEFSSIAFFLKELDYYVELDLITAPKNETYYTDSGDKVEDEYFIMGELSGFDSINITGRNTDGNINFKVVDANTPPYSTMYLMTSPRKQCGDVDAIASLLTPLSNGFRSTACLSLRATSTEKSQYGITNPLYKVTYVVKNVTYVLTVGNKIDAGEYAGSYPVMVNGNPSLMVASADVLPFVNNKSVDYTSDNIYTADIGKIKSLSANIKGKAYNFVLTHGKENEDLVVTLNGKTIDTEKFRDMYIEILSLSTRGDVTHATDAKNAKEELSLTFKYVDLSHTDKLAFYPYSDRRYSCLLNGAGDWTMYSTSVENVIKAVEGLAQ